MAKKILCPSFFCNGVGVPVSQNGFKVGKSIINNAIGFGLAGPIGGLVGAATGFNGKKKTTFVCTKCGRTWTKKV